GVPGTAPRDPPGARRAIVRCRGVPRSAPDRARPVAPDQPEQSSTGTRIRGEGPREGVMVAATATDRRFVLDQLGWSTEVRHLLALLEGPGGDGGALGAAAAAVLALLPPGSVCRYHRAALARLLCARGVTLAR